jgi:hypothetical protein
MNRESPGSAQRPVLLLGRYGEALSALVATPALRDCFVVTTPEEAAVDELTAALRPTAVLLEASEFYLEGHVLPRRLRRRSPGTRVFFLDIDRSWALWIEAGSEETQDLLIAPCELARAGEGLKDLLDGAGGFPRAAGALPLEPTG